MGNQTSAITARDGSNGHDIEMTLRAPAAGGGGGGGATDHQHEEEADTETAAITADDPHAGSEEEANTRVEVRMTDSEGGEGDVHKAGIRGSMEAVHIDIITAGGGATEEEEANTERAANITGDGPPIRSTPQKTGAGMESPVNGQQAVQGKRDSGIFPNISTCTLSAGTLAVFRPTPKGLYPVTLLIAAYDLNIIMLLVLSILLFGLTFALDLVPDNWVRAVRAAATTVAVALLVLLLFLVAFVTYGRVG